MDPEEIDKLIDEGLADVAHGDTIDGDDAITELRGYSAERRGQRDKRLAEVPTNVRRRIVESKKETGTE